jgi:hypothetical protein
MAFIITLLLYLPFWVCRKKQEFQEIYSVVQILRTDVGDGDLIESRKRESLLVEEENGMEFCRDNAGHVRHHCATQSILEGDLLSLTGD